MSEYLIKRSVEEKPKERGVYWTDGGASQYDPSYKSDKWRCPYTSSADNPQPEFWYEPITLPEIIEGAMPTDKETRAEADKLYSEGNIGNSYVGFIRGMEWLKTKLTKQ